VPFGQISAAPLQQCSAVPVQVEIMLWPNYCLDLLPINTWLEITGLPQRWVGPASLVMGSMKEGSGVPL